MWLVVVIVAIILVHGDAIRIAHNSEAIRQRHIVLDKGGDADPRTKGENEPSFWHTKGLDLLKEKLSATQNNNIAKNVILFLGDGMSMPTITASRIYRGQLEGRPGEETKLSFESFPHTGLSKTYCVNSQVADSACSTTAYLSGVKGNIETIGVTSDVKKNDCAGMMNQTFRTHSIVEWAQEAGKGTGVVTTTAITDASPTGAYGHIANRYWQSDTAIARDVTESPEKCDDIAKQLVMGYPGKNIKVVFGGGLEMFTPKERNDSHGTQGSRSDKLDLVQAWQQDKQARNATSQFVYNRTQLLSMDISSTDYVLGLFSSENLDYHLDAHSDKQPTLAEMTTIAIRMLQKEKNGFFLFVEGGLIDLGHHLNEAHKALDETVEFSKAVEVALNLTSADDTLIVVTADHSHTMAINGYPSRGSNILTNLQAADDGLPYSTLTYANGPHNESDHAAGMRHNMSGDDLNFKDYTFPTIFKMEWETHGGDDVAVYARGPSSHLLVGNYEQTYIPHAMAYAARIGPGNIPDTQKTSSAVTCLFSSENLDYHLDADSDKQPTLAEMTSVAIRMLQKEKNGFFLFVEGGLIDLGHHLNEAHKALDETVEFSKAVEVALNLTSADDTLIVVTADHSHTMAINGYPSRGSNILTNLQAADDGLPYSTLTYANGPHNESDHAAGMRHNMSGDDLNFKDYTFPTIFKMEWETHGGDDVAVYARGPSSHLLVGNYEQTYIPHAMAYAARIGPGNISDTQKTSSAVTCTPNNLLRIVFCLILFKFICLF